MTDIVRWLLADADAREDIHQHIGGNHPCRLAADEIERLREALKSLADPHPFREGSWRDSDTETELEMRMAYARRTLGPTDDGEPV